MWGSFLVKRDNYKNLTKWILLPYHVQRHVFCKACENCQKSGFISKHKESLDNLLLTFGTYPSGNVHCAFHNLWPYFYKEHVRHSLGNLTIKDHVYQFLRKLDGKPILDPQRVFKPFLDVKPREDTSHNHNYLYIHMFWSKIKRERERERKSETPAGLHIGSMIAFSISHL